MSLEPLHKTILIAYKYRENIIVRQSNLLQLPIAIRIEAMYAKMEHIHFQAEWVNLLGRVYFLRRLQTK